jgi:hypothetical protein
MEEHVQLMRIGGERCRAYQFSYSVTEDNACFIALKYGALAVFTAFNDFEKMVTMPAVDEEGKWNREIHSSMVIAVLCSKEEAPSKVIVFAQEIQKFVRFVFRNLYIYIFVFQLKLGMLICVRAICRPQFAESFYFDHWNMG